MTSSKNQYHKENPDGTIELIVNNGLNMTLKFSIGKKSEVKLELRERKVTVIDFNREYSLDSFLVISSDPLGYHWREDKINLLDPRSRRMEIERGRYKDMCYFYPFSVLHEVGHFKRHRKLEPPEEIEARIGFEIDAWIYAFHEVKKYKLPYSEDEMYDHIEGCLRTYISKKRLRKRIK